MTLTIYQTNDLHSNFENIARIAAYIKDHRKKEDLFLDCGDLCDLKDITVQGTRGIGAVRILKHAGVDAMAVGNNEIDLENKSLVKCAGEDIKMLSCNITDNDKNPLDGITGSAIFNRCGVRFLVIGISPYYSKSLKPGKYNVFFQMGNLSTNDPITQINDEIKRNKGQYDFCILLSHSGINVEHMILEKIPQIDLCLGGHTHTICCEEKYIQSGYGGECLGIVTLNIENGKVTGFSTKHVKITDEIKSDDEILSLWNSQRQIAERNLDKTLFTIKKMDWSIENESLLTNFIAEALYNRYECDFAFINSGIVEGPAEGAISKKRLIELSPSKLNPTRFPVKGADIKSAIRDSFDTFFVNQSGKGAGVRGHVLGTLGFSHNVKINKNPFSVFINGQALDEDKIYICVADDSLQRGTGYTQLAVPDEKAEFFDGFIRDLLERTLQDENIMKLALIKRIS